MKPTIFFTFLLLPTLCFAQVCGTILNTETLEPIPYVNISIENSSIGTTSDINGYFLIKEIPPDKRLFISSVGYETQYLIVSDSVIQIFLKPITYEIGQITVKPTRSPKTIQVHKIPSRNCSNHLACSSYPWMSARYFEYKDEYQAYPIIKEIKILTSSAKSGSKFNIRLLSPNGNGEPFENIVSENIIVTPQKGNHITFVNIERFNLKFPVSGLFVAAEWLIIDENKYNFIYTMRGEKTKRNEIRYDPKFGTFPAIGTILTWSYGGGKWTQNSFQKVIKNGEYLDLAIELVLSE